MLGLEMPLSVQLKNEAIKESVWRERKVYLLSSDLILTQAVIEVPILGREESFSWKVWTSIRQEEFLKHMDTDLGKPKDESRVLFAVLESDLPYYSEDTRGYKLLFSFNRLASGGLPLAIIDTESQLRKDQMDGVSFEQFQGWMELLYSGNMFKLD
ncbi:MAG: DUF2199 domain-containing protein [Bacteroidota bacterium]